MKCQRHSNTDSAFIITCAGCTSVQTGNLGLMLGAESKARLSTAKCHIHGNVMSNWCSSCPTHLSTTRCDLPASLATCSLCSLRPSGTVYLSLLEMDLSWHPLATECLILTSRVTSQPTAFPGLHLTFFGTPSPNISLLFKILWRKVIIGLLTEETFHHKRSKHITIYDLWKQQV